MKIKKFDFIFVLLCLLLIVIGSFYDFQISAFLFNPGSLFGKILAVYGMYPAYLFLFVVCLYLFFNFKEIIYKIISILIYLYLIYDCLQANYKYGLNINIFLSVIILVLIYIVPSYYLYKYLNTKQSEQINKLIIFMFVYIILQVIVINILKVIWLRPRMILISTNENYSFLPWYKFGKYLKDVSMDLFRSFPSGHTSSATTILLIKHMSNSKYNNVLVAIFIIIVAVSRLIIGAHFLTDVAFGALISFLLYKLVYKYVYLNIK